MQTKFLLLILGTYKPLAFLKYSFLVSVSYFSLTLLGRNAHSGLHSIIVLYKKEIINPHTSKWKIIIVCLSARVLSFITISCNLSIFQYNKEQ